VVLCQKKNYANSVIKDWNKSIIAVCRVGKVNDIS
jgi:hypothetical protein